MKAFKNTLFQNVFKLKRIACLIKLELTTTKIMMVNKIVCNQNYLIKNTI